MRVSGILASKGTVVETIHPGDSVAMALRQLRTLGIGALVVSTDGTRLEGVFSERDAVRHLAEHGAEVLDQPVEALMSTSVRTCEPEDSVEHLMQLMTNLRTRHLPVVVDGKLVGLVSIGDVVKTRVNELEDERQHLHDYIVTGR